MRKFPKLVIFAWCITQLTYSIYSQSLRKSSDLLAGYQIMSLCSKGSQVAALTLKVEEVNGSQRAVIKTNLLDNGKWSTLSDSIEQTNRTLKYTLRSQVVFDSASEIWTSSNSAIYKYNMINNKWMEYVIRDSLASLRNIQSIVSSKNGEKYCFTFADIPVDSVIENGQKFYIIGHSVYEVFALKDSRFEKIFYEKVTGIGYAGVLSISKSGDLVFARSSLENSLLFYKDNTWSYSTLNTPIGSRHRQQTKQIVPDSAGGLWFAYDSPSAHNSGFSSGGLSYLRADGTWKHFLPSDGMPNLIRRNEPDGARSISIDKSGNIWVGLISGLVRLNNEHKIDTIDLLQPKQVVPFSELYTDDTTRPIYNYPRWSVDYSTITDDGSIWLSYTPYGLIRYKPNSTTSVLYTFNTAPQEHILYQCSSSTLHIPIDENFTTQPTPKVFDYTGKELPMQQFYYTDNTLSVDVSHLSNGMYYLSLTTQEKGNTFFFTVHR